jgi:hypothetical protein
MWIYVIVVAILIFGAYAFLAITGVQVRWLSRRSTKTAESMYDNYGDSDRKQQRYARQHGETWAGAEGSEPRRPELRAVTARNRPLKWPLCSPWRPAPLPAGVHDKKTGRI